MLLTPTLGRAAVGQASLGERFAARRTGGFDLLRLGLALAVLLWHNFNIALGLGPMNGFDGHPATVLVRMILPLFFALSGFLVASSLERTPTLDIFLWHRAVRLFPALAVETILSALLLGPLLTSLPRAAYFAAPDFALYLRNIVGLVHFTLPGVFTGNPYPDIVNGSLWTIPYELECYLLLSVLALARATQSRHALLVILALLTAWVTMRHGAAPLGFVVPGRRLLLDFLAGIIVFKLRDRLPGGSAAGLVSLSAAAALMSHGWTAALSPLLVAHAVAALGCTAAPRPRPLARGDYSYGIYLYAFPIQQTVVHLIGGARPMLSLALSLVFVAAFAAFSWHAVERPLLRFKSLLDRKRG